MSDDTLSVEQITLIRGAFPDLSWESAQLLGSGWDHDAWALDQTVMRIPRVPVEPGYFAREAQFLDLIHLQLAVPTPRVTHLSQDASLLGYDLLPGVALTDANLTNLTPVQHEDLARTIAQFFSELHAITKEETATLQPIHRRATDHVNWLQAGIAQHLRGVIPDAECDTFEQFLPLLHTTMADAPLQVVLHGDFGLDAVLYDPNGGQTAVIDFSNWAIGDPALDFAGLTWSAPDLAQTVLGCYALRERAGNVLERARVYNRMVAASLMIHASLGADIPLHEARADFRRRFAIQ